MIEEAAGNCYYVQSREREGPLLIHRDRLIRAKSRNALKKHFRWVKRVKARYAIINDALPRKQVAQLKLEDCDETDIKATPT